MSDKKAEDMINYSDLFDADVPETESSVQHTEPTSEFDPFGEDEQSVQTERSEHTRHTEQAEKPEQTWQADKIPSAEHTAESYGQYVTGTEAANEAAAYDTYTNDIPEETFTADSTISGVYASYGYDADISEGMTEAYHPDGLPNEAKDNSDIVSETPVSPSENEKAAFSDYFEQQAAFGNAFVSTVDRSMDDLAGNGSGETLSFISHGRKPVIDSDGMIVIYDAEKGIDKTGTVELEIARMTYRQMRQQSEIGKVSSDSGRYAPDRNLTEPQADETTGRKGGIRALFPMKGDSVGEIIRKCVFLTAGCVFIGAGVMLISTLAQSNEAQKDLEEIKHAVTTTVATTIDSDGNIETIPPTTEEREQHNESIMNDFISVSGDVRGFIELPGCDIYYPVVQGKDNNYYLTHTYDNKTNKAGSIFMDYRCVLSSNYFSPNIVLYGHNQEDGTMFGNLKQYKNNVEFYKQNPFVTFNTEYGLGDYVIFACFVTNIYPKQDYYGEVFHYHDYINDLANRTTFEWYLSEVEERNQFIPVVDVKFGDELLVLSTCSSEFNDIRFVVIARRLRAGEEKSDFDFSATRINPNAKKIDRDAILYGRTAPSATSPTSFSIVTTETTESTVTVSESSASDTEKTSSTSAKKKKKKKKKTGTETNKTGETKKTAAAASESTEKSETTTAVSTETILKSETTVKSETSKKSQTSKKSETTAKSETATTVQTTSETTDTTVTTTVSETTEETTETTTVPEDTLPDGTEVPEDEVSDTDISSDSDPDTLF